MSISYFVRKALEELYDGTVTCITREKTFNEKKKVTDYVEKIQFEDVPCRLSHSKTQVNTVQAPAEHPAQEIKLFVAPEVTIPPASKLVVTQNGVTRCYRQSGVPAVYQSHQEILVELSERWS